MTTTVEIPRPDKVMFPDGTTKQDLARYYERVAEVMIPLVRDRPVHMQRFPDGIDRQQIQQKQAPAYFPDFIERVAVPRRQGGSIEQVMINSPETLVYLVGQACITPHVWLSRADALERPDRLVFDLDPSTRDLATLRDAARSVRQLLEDVGLAAYLMTTGSRGYHVVTPLDRSANTDTCRELARALAVQLARRDPQRLTTQQRKDRRDQRLYLDIARNGYAQTVVAPYAVRPRDGEPIACPINWGELSRTRPEHRHKRGVSQRRAGTFTRSLTWHERS
jgi:bifunctional non-homologous end joining protein LigD